MTQDEIIEMAVKAGFFIDLGEICTASSQEIFTSVHEELEAFAKLVAAKEREDCAQICENIYTGEESCQDWPTPEQCAEAIRVRK